MSDEKEKLEQLEKTKENLIKQLKLFKHEEKLFIASKPNRDHVQLMKQLRDQSKPPKQISDLISTQNKKLKLSDKSKVVSENKLIEYYETFTGVKVINTSLETSSVKAANNCIYIHKTHARIDNLYFNITYRSNKPPNGVFENKEIIDELEITLDKHSIQKEVQEGITYFSKHPSCIRAAIRFLKSVNDLTTTRGNICKELLTEYKNYLQVSSRPATGHIILKCEGINNPQDYFIITWMVKWNPTNNLARDSFIVEVSVSDSQLKEETEYIFAKLCKHDSWSQLDDEEKFTLLKNAIVSLIDADSRPRKNDSQDKTVEYSTENSIK